MFLAPKRFCTEFSKRSFSYSAPNVCNNLPLEIRLFFYAYYLQMSPQTVPIQVTSPSSHLHSHPPSDCRRLRFSLYVDIACLTNLHCVSKKPELWNFLLQLCENCFNINKNWYTQPAYDVIKLQYYKTVAHITLAQQYWNAPVITSWFLYHQTFWVSANNKH